MKATKVTGLVAAVFMAMFLFQGMVIAESPVGIPEEEVASGDIFPAEPTGQGGDDDVAADQSTWSCHAKADDPHFSTHAARRGEKKVNTEGWVRCTEAMSLIEMRLTLNEQTCVFIIFCSSKKVADTGWLFFYGLNYKKINVAIPCVEADYFGRLSVVVSGYDGAVGQRAFKSNVRHVSCDG